MTNSSKATWRSPNEMLQAGVDIMLDGRQPQSEEDWILLVNFWAVNTYGGLEVQVCNIMRLVFQVPLTVEQVGAIADYQATLKKKNGGGK